MKNGESLNSKKILQGRQFRLYHLAKWLCTKHRVFSAVQKLLERNLTVRKPRLFEQQKSALAQCGKTREESAFGAVKNI